MKSTVKFDLDSEDNRPIIQATIVLTDDVRDKIAKKFIEGFCSNACLLHAEFPNEEVMGGGTVVRIYSHNDSQEAANFLVSKMGDAQARYIQKALEAKFAVESIVQNPKS